jgi:hypothetical protein
MKKIVLTFGVISGLILSALMVSTIWLVDRIGMDGGMVLGYTTMVLAFLMVFFGIKSYRDNVAGGQISFGKAFIVGILIMLIACVFYVVSWQIVYFNFIPDFTDKYAAYVMDKARASGATAEELAQQAEQIKYFVALYQNPLYNAAFTIIEPLPVGLPMTLISAAILRKRRKVEVNGPEQREHAAA